MEKKSLSLKLTIKMFNFQHNSVSEAYLMDLVSAIESREVSLNGNVYDFQLITILLINLTF